MNQINGIQINNIQEYVVNKIISYIEEKNETHEHMIAKVKNMSKTHKIKICQNCLCYIFINRNLCASLYEKGVFRRCGNYRPCRFIICAKCEGEAPDSDYKTNYEWTGNSWFGIPPRPIQDDDYICCPECPGI